MKLKEIYETWKKKGRWEQKQGDKEKGDRCGGQGGETVSEKEVCVWLSEVEGEGGERERGDRNKQLKAL